VTNRHPNVIVFFTDQQRHDTMGAYGCPLGLTPNFDHMAARGTHLLHHFTCQPVCAPARSCLQTGLYATQTGVWRNGLALDPSCRTLAHHFGAAGYHTGYIGKWHLAPAGTAGPVSAEFRGGYQSWLAANDLEATSDAYDARLWDENNCEHRLPGYRVDALTDAAIRQIDAQRHHPFFLFVSHLEPHHQNHRDDYPAPTGYAERYGGSWMPPDLAALRGSAPQHWAGYCGMIKRLDEALGRLLDVLRSRDLLRNTIVLFTSDHGNHFKTRNDEYKRSCHEASIRTPAALCGPGFDGGGTVPQLVSLIDLPPTLLEAAGLPVPREMAGKSLLGIIHGPRAAWPQEVFVQISESQTGRAIRTSRWKYSVRSPERKPDGSPKSAASADVYEDEYLYDLLADPWEQTNLIGISSFRGITLELRAALIRRMTAAGESEPRFIDAAGCRSDQRRPFFSGQESCSL
jgi:arylsulfatase A-like enzyme